jgi:diguanylate cyclase (GGDEF)-like protein
VDDFKLVNDTYGHIEGDRALKKIAQVLRMACGNRRCFLGRYGGDEFMIVYEQETGLLPVEAVVKAIHQGIDELNASKRLKRRMSVSIGCVPYSLQYASIQHFIEAADIRMYEMKKAAKV